MKEANTGCIFKEVSATDNWVQFCWKSSKRQCRTCLLVYLFKGRGLLPWHSQSVLHHGDQEKALMFQHRPRVLRRWGWDTNTICCTMHVPPVAELGPGRQDQPSLVRPYSGHHRGTHSIFHLRKASLTSSTLWHKGAITWHNGGTTHLWAWIYTRFPLTSGHCNPAVGVKQEDEEKWREMGGTLVERPRTSS